MSAFTSFSDSIFDCIRDELSRQQNHIELIASENIVSPAVLAAQGSILTNKYAEGYPGKRYYGGCEFVDKVELLAIERAKQLFGCHFANVQAHSGSQANQAVFMALLKPGDTFLGMSLSAGGHLTHGAAPNFSGKWFNAQSYGVDPMSGLLNYEEIERLAKLHQPKLIIAGGSAYVRQIDFARMKAIAEGVGAFLMVDVAHYAGLIVGGVYPSPFPYADVVTSTTHKTLRGPRGGIILTNNEALAKKIDAAIFPGMQGGPLMHVIAAKAVAFQEALLPAFKEYARNMLENARTLGKVLKQRDIALVSGGTDCHMVLVDLTSLGQGNITGKDAEYWLDKAGLTSNKNSTPNDARGPTLTSGIRLGSPAGTTRGFGELEFTKIANCIANVLEALARAEETILEQTIKRTREEVNELCHAFPIYNNVT